MDERLEEFLERCLLLDLETGPAGAIHKIGAVWREETFLRQGRFELKVALAELDGFATDADFLLGHNLLGQVFGWGREMVQTGLAEKRTGIVCMGAKASFTGNQRWEEKHPEVAADLRRLAEEHAQQEPSFRSTIAFTRLTAAQALRQLRALGHKDEDLPAPREREFGNQEFGNSAEFRGHAELSATALKSTSPLQEHSYTSATTRLRYSGELGFRFRRAEHRDRQWYEDL